MYGFPDVFLCVFLFLSSPLVYSHVLSLWSWSSWFPRLSYGPGPPRFTSLSMLSALCPSCCRCRRHFAPCKSFALCHFYHTTAVVGMGMMPMGGRGGGFAGVQGHFNPAFMQGGGGGGGGGQFGPDGPRKRFKMDDGA